MKSANGKFEIVYQTRDDDSYFYSYTDYSWYVIAVATGDELMDFYGHWNQGRGDDDKGGAENVTFTSNSDAVVVNNFDGTTERHELPVDVRIVDGGNAIDLTWPGGRVERRERAPCIATTKYGQPYAVRDLVKDPSDAPPKKGKKKK
jgi:hypothetical protein